MRGTLNLLRTFADQCGGVGEGAALWCGRAAALLPHTAPSVGPAIRIVRGILAETVYEWAKPGKECRKNELS